MQNTLEKFFNKDNSHNELIAYAAKPMAIFAKNSKNNADKNDTERLKKKIQNMPESLKEYAVKYDLPVLDVRG